PYSILFRGCSFLIAYESGVFCALRDLSPDIMKSASRIYGSSSGSAVATAGLCGCDMGKGYRFLFILYEAKEYFLSRLKPSLWGLVPGGRVQKLLRDTLYKFLPPNAHELVSGKLHIVLTRLHDWRSVTVSEFASKEELIQVGAGTATPAPCCVSQRYVDGELAMWRADFVSRSTITISAFAGEYDICPKDGPAAFLTFQLSDCILQISKMNICRFVYLL
ncbi:PLPL1 protein, partial [Erythrocercus mccallii]|nr:PLPL1 protein [Erythrocercus mccallii]